MTAIADAPAPPAHAAARPATTDRRAVLIGGALLATTLPLLLRPVRQERLVGTGTLAALIPPAFGSWRSVPDDSLVSPDEPDVYDEVVQRTYSDAGGRMVMLSIAYGRAANRRLTLHIPEGCYPAQGFTVSRSEPVPLTLAPGLTVPGHRMQADRGDRHETVLYWRRIGREIPASTTAEFLLYYRRALEGVTADGALVRVSMIGVPFEAASSALADFARALVAACSPVAQTVLLGRTVAGR